MCCYCLLCCCCVGLVLLGWVGGCVWLCLGVSFFVVVVGGVVCLMRMMIVVGFGILLLGWWIICIRWVGVGFGCCLDCEVLLLVFFFLVVCFVVLLMSFRFCSVCVFWVVVLKLWWVEFGLGSGFWVLWFEWLCFVIGEVVFDFYGICFCKLLKFFECCCFLCV